MKQTCFAICVLVSVAINLFGTDLRDVLAHPEKFQNQRITVIGIARVPGYFYLCADKKAATDRHPAIALSVRRKVTQSELRGMDRQWIRVTGIVTDDVRRGWERGAPSDSSTESHPGILLEEINVLSDRPQPRIKDSTVWGVFKNETSQALAIQLVPRVVPGVGTIFFLAPHETQATEVDQGRADALKLEGPTDLPLHKQKSGERVATGQITFRSLQRGWEYSRELSGERTLYFRVVGNRIEEVPASEGKHWKVR